MFGNIGDEGQRMRVVTASCSRACCVAGQPMYAKLHSVSSISGMILGEGKHGLDRSSRMMMKDRRQKQTCKEMV